MKCPVCNIDLLMSERQGIEIDYCPNCRGVWLDRGELDKIVERASVYAAPQTARPVDAERAQAVSVAPDHDARSCQNPEERQYAIPGSQQIPPQAVQAAKALTSVIGNAAGAKKASKPAGKNKKKDFLGSLFDF